MAISTINTGRYIDVNDMFLQVLGFSRDEVIGITSPELNIFEDVHQRDFIKSSMKDNGFAKDVEVKVRTKTGKILVGLFSASNINIGDEPCWLTTMTDITARKQAEEALAFSNIILRTQQESSIDGILVVDEKGEILSFNQRFVEMWGIPPDAVESKSDERALQSVLDKLVSPEEFIIKVKHLYEIPDEICMDEIVLKGGRIFDRYSAPMFGAERKYYGRVWNFRDITKRKQIEEALEQISTRLSLAIRAGGVGVWDYDLVKNRSRPSHFKPDEC